MAGAGNVGTAYVTIVPSMKGFAKSMNGALGGVDLDKSGATLGERLSRSISKNIDTKSISKGFSSAMQSAGSAMLSVGGTVGSAITAVFGGASAAATAFALNVAASAETSEMAFTTMLGSAEAAEKMMNDLATFAAKTPFELSGLISSTQQLLAYGYTAEDVIPMLTAVGDATSALGTGQIGIDAVTRALGQMKTKGKVSGEEMLQLTEQGISAWQYLADAIGTDTAGAMEQVSSGAITAEEGIKAITEGMERDFGGMMENQAKTLVGLMSNLSDAIEQPLMQLKDTSGYDALTDSLAGIIDKVSPLVEKLLPYFDSGLQTAAGAVDMLGAALDTLSTGDTLDNVVQLAGGIAALGPAMVVSGAALQAAAPLTEKLSAGLELTNTAVGSLAGALPKAKGAVTGFAKSAGTGLVTALTKTKTGFQQAAIGANVLLGVAQQSGPLEALKIGVSLLGDTAKTAGPALGTSLCNGIQSVMTSVTPFMSILANSSLVLGAFGTGIAAVALLAATAGMDFGAFATGVSQSLGMVGTLITTTLTNLTAAIPAAIAGIQTAGPILVTSFTNLFMQIGTALSTFLPAFGQVVLTIVPYICQLIAVNGPLLLQGAMTLFGNILTGLSLIIPQIVAYIPTFISGIVSALATGIPTILQGGVDLFSALCEAIPQVLPEISAALPQIAETIASQLPTAVPQVIEGAFQLLIGIVQAVPQVLPDIIAAVGELANSIATNLPSYISQIGEGARQLFQAIGQSVGEVAPEVLSAVGDLIMQIPGHILSFVGALLDAGYNLVMGFVEGIMSAAGAVLDAIGNVVGGAIDFAMGLLGEHSPSKVFKQIGNWLMQGFEIGMDEEERNVNDTIQGILDTANHTAIKAIQKLGDSLAELEDNDAANEFGQYLQELADDANAVAKSARNFSNIGRVFERTGVKFSESFLKEISKGDSKYREHLDEMLTLTDEQLQAIVDMYTQADIDSKIMDVTEALMSDEGLRWAFEATGQEINGFVKDMNEFGLTIEDVQSKVNSFSATVSDGFTAMSMFNSDVDLDTFTSNLENNIRVSKYWARQVNEVFDKVADYESSENFRKAVLEGGIDKYGRMMIQLAGKTREEIIKVIDLYNDAVYEGYNAGMSVTSALIPDVSQYYDVGNDIAEGIAEGIEDGEGAVIGAAKKISYSIEKTVKDYFGISSPSRLMKHLFGYVGDGAAIGLKASGAAVSDVMADISARVERTAARTKANISAFGKAAFNERSGLDVANIDQTIIFQRPVQTPYQTANAMKSYATYGLAGAR